ncbi:MAG: glycosyltransferase [Cyanobacteriota bacterium]|nr:glycosyltransferase [Cyanobacteriota bacterium]
MRVLHVIPSISPLRGGPSHAVLSMVAALRHQGVDASILTSNDHGPGIQPAMPLGRWHQQEALGEAVPILAFGRMCPPARALCEFTIAPGLSRWLGMNARRYDLVHVHALFSYTTSLGMAQLRRQRVPYFLRTIGQLNRWSLSQSKARKQVFLKLVERANLQGAQALHFTSEAEREEAGDLHLATPSFVLPLGVPAPPKLSLSNQSVGNTSGPTRLLFLSRLHPKKQLPVLFDALAVLKQRHPLRPWELAIAGDGDPEYVQQLQHLCNTLGLAPQVRWHGFVEGAAKQALLQQSDWFVLPSASENFGIAAAEALMAGTPVVLSPGVALAAQVQAAQAGMVCEPTVEALAACLEGCMEPPPQCMRQAARQLAEQQFSWATISCQLMEHYAEALRG